MYVIMRGFFFGGAIAGHVIGTLGMALPGKAGFMAVFAGGPVSDAAKCELDPCGFVN